MVLLALTIFPLSTMKTRFDNPLRPQSWLPLAWAVLTCSLCSLCPVYGATVLHFMTLSDNVWPANVKKVIAAFETQNPDIKVELDTYPFRQLFETIEVRMKAQDKDVDLISVDVPLV